VLAEQVEAELLKDPAQFDVDKFEDAFGELSDRPDVLEFLKEKMIQRFTKLAEAQSAQADRHVSLLHS
jgi:hypothetical protein